MTIDTDALNALGDNWMVRTDDDGEGYGGFRWAPVGEWTECPKWSDKTTADCKSGGLFGQGPGGYGHAQPGTRFVFCETGPERMAVEGNKVKVRRARILYVGADALKALIFVTGGIFPGSLTLRGCALPEGLVLPQTVGGSLDLSGCTLPEGIALPQTVGGGLDLSGCTLPEGLALPQTVGGGLYLRGCTLPEGIALPQTVGCSLDLGGCTLPKGLVLPQTVGGGLDLGGCTLPKGLVLPQTVGGWLDLSGCTLPEGLVLPQTVGGSIYR